MRTCTYASLPVVTWSPWRTWEPACRGLRVPSAATSWAEPETKTTLPAGGDCCACAEAARQPRPTNNGAHTGTLPDGTRNSAVDLLLFMRLSWPGCTTPTWSIPASQGKDCDPGHIGEVPAGFVRNRRRQASTGFSSQRCVAHDSAKLHKAMTTNCPGVRTRAGKSTQ